MEARLPSDKVQWIIEFIDKLLCKSICTKLEILQLLGNFNFASRDVFPGRAFVSYLIHLASTVKTLWDRVVLDEQCRDYLEMWLKLLHSWNGVYPFYDTMLTHSNDSQTWSLVF